MYSIDYKQRTIAFKDEGHTFKELKEAFNIPPETYYLWKEKLENGYYDKKIIRERKRKIDKNELKQALIEKPDAYLRELAEQFGCTAAAVFYALKKLNITRKKRPLPIPKSPESSVKNIRVG
jgi:transposase